MCGHLKTHLKLFQSLNLVTRCVCKRVSVCEDDGVCADPFYKVYLQTYRDQSNLLSHKTEAQWGGISGFQACGLKALGGHKIVVVGFKNI